MCVPIGAGQNVSSCSDCPAVVPAMPPSRLGSPIWQGSSPCGGELRYHTPFSFQCKQLTNTSNPESQKLRACGELGKTWYCKTIIYIYIYYIITYLWSYVGWRLTLYIILLTVLVDPLLGWPNSVKGWSKCKENKATDGLSTRVRDQKNNLKKRYKKNIQRGSIKK